MSLSDTYENVVLDALLGDGKAAAMPATVYVALFTAAPGETGGGTEVSGGAYDRVAVANTTVNWPDAAAGQKSNGVAIEFIEATASWGTISHFALMDAATGGDVIIYGALTTSKPIASGEQAVFAPTTLVLTAD